jgi:chloramphenicol-sensitive protein RarD
VTAERGRGGLAYGLAAHGLWGVMPLYFHAVQSVPPAELLAHRIVWSALLLLGLLTLTRRWPALIQAIRTLRTRNLLLVSSALIAVNWYVYIYAAATQQIVQASLGYFINPLFSVVLGMVVFGERLRPIQWAAIALAAAGMVYLVWSVGVLPWIALVLAASFGVYGLVRKVAPVDALTGLAAETMVLSPAALICLLAWTALGRMEYRGDDAAVNVLLPLSAVVTTAPLFCFGEAARRLPLSVMGFLQYVAPSIQLVLSVLALGEPFPRDKQIGFGLIWAALALLTAESVWSLRRRAKLLAAAEDGKKRAPDGSRDGACDHHADRPAAQRPLRSTPNG